MAQLFEVGKKSSSNPYWGAGGLRTNIHPLSNRYKQPSYLFF